MDRKLIFLDIDGTILAHGEEVHPAVLEGLRRARNKGHMVFISTGRSHGSVPPEILDMETDGLIAVQEVISGSMDSVRGVRHWTQHSWRRPVKCWIVWMRSVCWRAVRISICQNAEVISFVKKTSQEITLSWPGGNPISGQQGICYRSKNGTRRIYRSRR